MRAMAIATRLRPRVLGLAAVFLSALVLGADDVSPLGEPISIPPSQYWYVGFDAVLLSLVVLC